MVEVTLHEGYVLHDHCLSIIGQIFGTGQDNSRKCTHYNRINYTIDRCWELHDKSFRPPRAAYLSDSAGSFTVHDSNTLGTFTDEYATLPKSEYNLLLKRYIQFLLQTLLP
mgnify:CR=1 FL=1